MNVERIVEKVVELMEEESAGKEAKTVRENVEERASAKRIGIPILQAAPTVETQKTETVPIVTGEVEEKRIKLSEVHQDIERLRKLSQDYVEMERKKSVEIMNPVGAETHDSNGFVFSDDDNDDFDVPDAPI